MFSIASISDGENSYFEGVGNEVLAATLVFGLCLIYFVAFVIPKWFAGDVADLAQIAADNLQQGRVRADDHTCAICLGSASLAVETNCGHVYCGSCIIQLYEHSRQEGHLTAPSCPYCRQRITMLLPYFSEEERNWAELEEVDRRNDMGTRLAHFNRRFSNESRSISEHIRDLPAFVRYLLRSMASGQGLTLYFRLRVLVFFAVFFAYTIIPTDLVPEAVFGPLGLIDDLVFGALLVFAMANQFRADLAQE